MRYRFLRYPGGKAKAVTFSYDDGIEQDIRLAETLNRYGIKGTFNINTAYIGMPMDDRKLTAQEIQTCILDAGHEVAVHGHHHRAPGLCTSVDVITEFYTCRKELEKIFGRIIRGMAYPDSGILRFFNGSSYETIRQLLMDMGIVYSRTLEGDNNKFLLPTDWYAWMPTAHHGNPKVLDYAREFVNINCKNYYIADYYPRLFYLWGHSYEFDRNNNWGLLEEICQTLGGKDDIWYATNIEIYDYVHAYESLFFSVDGSKVYNPTLLTVWFDVDGKLYSVNPGETLNLG